MSELLLPSTAATLVVAVDGLARTHANAEQQLRVVEDALGVAAWDPTTYVASTHAVGGHVALVLCVVGDPPGADAVASLLATVVADLPGSAALVRVGGSESHHGATAPVDDLHTATSQHLSRSSARLARFRGQGNITGRVSVADVVERTCIDRVDALAGTALGGDTVLDLGDFARPTWREGHCSLLVQQASWGIIPFEVRDQVACCADH